MAHTILKCVSNLVIHVFSIRIPSELCAGTTSSRFGSFKIMIPYLNAFSAVDKYDICLRFQRESLCKPATTTLSSVVVKSFLCNGCGMPTGDAYSFGHLVPSLWDLHMFYLLRPILFRTFHYFSGLCSSNIPRYFLDFAQHLLL